MYNLYSGNPSTQLDNGGFIIGKEEVLLGVGRGGGARNGIFQDRWPEIGQGLFLCCSERFLQNLSWVLTRGMCSIIVCE